MRNPVAEVVPEVDIDRFLDPVAKGSGEVGHRFRGHEGHPQVDVLRGPGVRTKPKVHRESALEEPGRLWVPEEPGQESLDDELELEGAQGDLSLGGELPQVRFQRSLERWRGSRTVLPWHSLPCEVKLAVRSDP